MRPTNEVELKCIESPPPALQNILRGCSGVLGADTAGLWRALAQNQNHPLAGGPGGLAELLEQYAQTLAQNMKLTYLNPVALVAPNIGECGPRGPHRRGVWP